jgi:hypothetical protein
MVPKSLSLSSARRASFSSKLFDHRAARKWALCSRCTVSYIRPPEPTTTIIHHGRVGLLSLFLPVRRLAAPNLFPKKIRQKQRFRHFQCKKATSAFSSQWRRKRRISFDLGGIFAYRLFEYSNIQKSGKQK